MKAIETEDLVKRFEGVKAVDNVSFSVQKGEIFGFLGPNGAGKTTTVRMLAGIIKPDSGRATILGYDVVDETLEVKKVIGVLPEVANAYPDISVWKNMMLIAPLYGIKRREAERKAYELLREFGLIEKRECKVKTLSKGMKQRLMLCMALVNDPDVLFLDEPTSGLDVQSARMMREKILELRKGGKTVFLTSHNMQEVNMLCDRICIINRGKIVTVDSPDRLRQKIGGSSVEIEFDKTVDPRMLSPDGRRVGDRYMIYTTDLHDTICSLIEFATNNGLKITSLNVHSPSLEDVFIKLTEDHDLLG